MKKILSILLVMVLCLGVVVNAASFEGIDQIYGKDIETKQQDTIKQMQEFSNQNNKEFKMQWDKEMGIPHFIGGKLSEKAVNNDSEAIAFLEENKDMFKLSKAEYKIKNVQKDELGMSHYKTNQLSDGIPVYGSEAIVHTNAEGDVYAVNNCIDNTVPNNSWKSMIKINEKKAIEAAEASLGLDSDTQVYGTEPTAEAYIYNNEGEWLPVYYVTLRFMKPYAANMEVFVNATTGDVIKSKNNIQTIGTTGTGTGVLGDTKTINIDNQNGTYYLRDLTKEALIETDNANSGIYYPAPLISDTDTNFNSEEQKAGVDAHYYAGITYDFYKNVLGRNSLDNAGTDIRCTVHYDLNYNNAFWDGTQLVFGDGDGTIFAPLCGSLEIVAHEFTHGVTQNTCNLVYENQSGALNESMSDVFGHLVNGDPTDWELGEDVWTPNIQDDCMRSMSNPEIRNQPAHMDDYVVMENTADGDWGGVHKNCGIPNKAFYLAATSINNDEHIAKIYYRALTTYITKRSTFADARTALEQAATDLYGASTAQKIADAFAAVGIVPGTPIATDNYEPNNTMTEAYGPITSATAYNSYIYSAADVDYYHFTTTTTGTITVTLTDLPADYNLYMYNSAGTLVASASTGSNTSESIIYNSTSSGKYYIKVYSSSSAEYNPAVPYKLTVTYPDGTNTAPPSIDTYEPNDSLATAYDSLTLGTAYSSYITSATDVDYFKFTTTASNSYLITLTTLPRDYNIYVYNSAGTQVAKAVKSGFTSERIFLDTPTAGTYYVKVVSAYGAFSLVQPYTLTAATYSY